MAIESDIDQYMDFVVLEHFNAYSIWTLLQGYTEAILYAYVTRILARNSNNININVYL